MSSPSKSAALSTLRASLSRVLGIKISGLELFGTLRFLIDNVYFYSLVRLFHLDIFDLDAESQPAAAVVGFCILNPTPGELFAFIPPLAFIETPELQEVYKNFNPKAGYLNTHLNSIQLKELFTTLSSNFPSIGGRAGKKTNLSVEDLFRLCQSLPKNNLYDRIVYMAIKLVELPPNNWGGLVAVSFCLLHMASPQGQLIQTILIHLFPKISKFSVQAVAKILKSLHHLFRTSKTNPFLRLVLSDEEVRQFYGIDTILGRHNDFDYDADKDILTRLVDPSLREVISPIDGSIIEGLYAKVLKSSIYESVWSACGLSYSVHTHDVTAKSKKIISHYLETFRRWYSRRFYWAAAGGAPGSKIFWDGKAERLNKRGALMFIDPQHFIDEYMYNDAPIMTSKAAPKFENGKIRTIWNTSLEHYVAQAYVLDNFERAWQSGTWNSGANTGVDELLAQQTRLLALREHYGTGFMWDYSDFNINHTFDAMDMLFTAVFKFLKTHFRYSLITSPNESDYNNLLIDRIQLYLHRSRHSTYLINDDSGVQAKVLRSMQSGERATSFQNTFLSRAYTLVLHEISQHFFSRSLLRPISYHQGDDVFAYSNSVPDATVASYLFNLLGYAGQQHKITADYSNRGEFLRYAYIVQDGRPYSMGYPIRSFMGLLGGEFFLDSVVDPGDRAMAFADQVDACMRRGSIIPRALYDILVARNCALVYHNEFNARKVVSVPLPLVQTPAFFGGYGTSSNFVAMGEVRQASEFKGRPQFVAALRNFVVPSSDKSNIPQQALFPSKMLDGLRLAICIPSGEGKTTLARKFADFIDPDDHVDFSLVLPLINNKNWDQVNRIHRATDYPSGKILLTWSVETIPLGYHFLGAFLLSEAHGVRLNIDNRAALVKTVTSLGLPIHSFDSYESRDKLIQSSVKSWVNQASSALALYSPLLLSKRQLSSKPYRQFNHSLNRPIYKPSIPDKELFTGKRSLLMSTPDCAALSKYHLSTRTNDIAIAIATDSLSGAFPASSVSFGYAKFAEELDRYLIDTTEVRNLVEIVVSDVPPSLPLLLYERLRSIILDFRERPNLYREIRNSFKIKHHYGFSHRIVSALGYNTVSTLMQLLDSPLLLSTGKFARLKEFLRKELPDDHPTHREFREFSELHSHLVGHLHSKDYHSNLFKYTMGDLDLLPAPSTGCAPAYASLMRDLVLMAVEDCKLLNLVLSIESRQLVAFYSYLEHSFYSMIIMTDLQLKHPILYG